MGTIVFKSFYAQRWNLWSRRAISFRQVNLVIDYGRSGSYQKPEIAGVGWVSNVMRTCLAQEKRANWETSTSKVHSRILYQFQLRLCMDKALITRRPLMFT